MRAGSPSRLLPFLALVTALGCDRGEPDRGATSTAVHHPEERVPATPSAVVAADPRCVVPLPDTPPPPAQRAQQCPQDPDAPPSMPRGWVSFPDARSAPRVEVEIAATGPTREHGLMYRTTMPEDQGMLFSWSEEGERTFWMHNTCLPLDMLFIAGDGTIAGILEQVPTLSDAPRGVPCPAAHVLEVNAGWCRAHGVAPGQHVRIET